MGVSAFMHLSMYLLNSSNFPSLLFSEICINQAFYYDVNFFWIFGSGKVGVEVGDCTPLKF